MIQHEILTLEGYRKSILEQLTSIADRLVAYRQKIKKEDPEKEKYFSDVCFSELIANPVLTIKNIYSQFGYEFTEEFEKRILEFVENQPREEYGRAKHSLNELKLTKQDVEKEFQNYISHYKEFF